MKAALGITLVRGEVPSLQHYMPINTAQALGPLAGRAMVRTVREKLHRKMM